MSATHNASTSRAWREGWQHYIRHGRAATKRDNKHAAYLRWSARVTPPFNRRPARDCAAKLEASAARLSPVALFKAQRAIEANP